MALPSLTLEEIRARVQSEKAAPFDPSHYEAFEHTFLGTTLYVTGLAPMAAARYDNIGNYISTAHENASLRGVKISSEEDDTQKRLKLLLTAGVRTSNGEPLDDELATYLMENDGGGDTKALHGKVLEKLFAARPVEQNFTQAQSHLDAAFFDLLVKCGGLKTLVELSTVNDETTDEARAAAAELLRYEQFAPEWARQRDSARLTRNLMDAADAERAQKGE